jgi:hypothetical protein
MKKLYGYQDSDGDIYAADETWKLEKVELVPNPTWEVDDYTDDDGGHWIRADRLAFLFNDLCKRTGMKKSVLAILCGVTPQTFSRYCNGITPVPPAIWRIVDIEARNMRGKGL